MLVLAPESCVPIPKHRCALALRSSRARVARAHPQTSGAHRQTWRRSSRRWTRRRAENVWRDRWVRACPRPCSCPSLFLCRSRVYINTRIVGSTQREGLFGGDEDDVVSVLNSLAQILVFVVACRNKYHIPISKPAFVQSFSLCTEVIFQPPVVGRRLISSNKFLRCNIIPSFICPFVTIHCSYLRSLCSEAFL